MANPGGYKPREYGTLKEAVARLVGRAGGLELGAERVRVGRSQLARYTDPAEPGTHMPVDIVLSLEAIAGDPIVTTHLAAAAGHALLPVMVRADAGTLARDIARIGREMAELMSEYGASQADGAIDATEARRMLREIDEGFAALGTMRSHLQAIVETESTES